MQNTLDQWYNAIKSIVSGMFNLYIVEGVSFGWFLVTVVIFTIIIDILFRKVIK